MVFISHKYKFIFIKPRKVAGSSIRTFLNLYMKNIDDNCIISSDEPGKLYSHTAPDEIKKMIGKEKYDKYFKFTIIRNPYDMVISWFWWDKRNKKICDNKEEVIKGFRYFVMNTLINFNKEFYNENIKYDYIIRYENLENDTYNVLKLIGIKRKNIKFPYEKSGIRDNSITIDEYYDDECINKVNSLFSYLFKMGDYEMKKTT